MLHVTKVRRLKKVVRSVNRVKPECLVMLRVESVIIAVLVNTVKAKKRMVKSTLIQRLVLIVQLVIHQVLVVPSANPVVLERTVLGVNRVTKVITATVVTLLRSPADIALLVTTVTTLVKVLVCPAFL